MSDRVNLECQLYLSNVRAIQYKLGRERLTKFGNLNILRLPVKGLISCCITDRTLRPHNCSGLHFQTPEGDKESLLSCKLFIKKFFLTKKLRRIRYSYLGKFTGAILAAGTYPDLNILNDKIIVRKKCIVEEFNFHRGIHGENQIYVKLISLLLQIYKYKVAISVCLSFYFYVGTIILTDLPQTLIEKLSNFVEN